MQRTAQKNIGKAEFMSLFHQYHSESLCGKKFQFYSQQVQDPQLRSMLQDMSNQCQQRSSWIASTLSECGGSQYISS